MRHLIFGVLVGMASSAGAQEALVEQAPLTAEGAVPSATMELRPEVSLIGEPTVTTLESEPAIIQWEPVLQGADQAAVVSELEAAGYADAASQLPEGDKFTVLSRFVAPGVTERLIVPEGGGGSVQLTPFVPGVDSTQVVSAGWSEDLAAATLERIEAFLVMACAMLARPAEIIGTLSVGLASVEVKWNVAEACRAEASVP